MNTELVAKIDPQKILSAVETFFKPSKEMGGTALVSESSLAANTEMRSKLDARAAYLKNAAVQAAQQKPTFDYYDKHAPGPDPADLTPGVTFRCQIDGLPATVNVPMGKPGSISEATRKQIVSENIKILNHYDDAMYNNEIISGGALSTPLFFEFPGDMTITLDHGGGVTERVIILDTAIPIEPEHFHLWVVSKRKE